MRAARLEQLLRRIGHWPRPLSGTWHYKVPCPYAASKHRGRDRHPSATISFDHGVSWLQCYGCGTRAPYLKALMETAVPGSGVASIAAEYLAEEAEEERRTGPERVLTAVVAQPVRNCTSALRSLARLNTSYPTALIDFLASKGVTAETARSFYVMFAPRGWTDEFQKPTDDGAGALAQDCVLIPVLLRGPHGLACVGAQARPLTGSGPKYFDVWPFPKTQLLYGEHLPDLAGGDLFIVEGALDVMHVRQCGLRALACFGTSLQEQKAARIARIGPRRALVFMDPDEAGAAVRDKHVATLRASGVDARAVVYDKQPKHCDREELMRLSE